jgi:hypothetical protein
MIRRAISRPIKLKVRSQNCYHSHSLSSPPCLPLSHTIIDRLSLTPSLNTHTHTYTHKPPYSVSVFVLVSVFVSEFGFVFVSVSDFVSASASDYVSVLAVVSAFVYIVVSYQKHIRTRHAIGGEVLL